MRSVVIAVLLSLLIVACSAPQEPVAQPPADTADDASAQELENTFDMGFEDPVIETGMEDLDGLEQDLVIE